ncbi:MAG: PAS domain-containing protein [Vicinamibacterales bacterium]
MRIVTDNARVGLAVVNLQRRYVYANGTYAEIRDLPSADIVGQRLQDVLGGAYEEQAAPRLDRAFGGQRVAYELRRPTATGDRFYEVRYEPIEVDGAAALVVVITGMTERRATASPIRDAAGRADAERRFQEARLTTERELTLDGILVVDDQSRVVSFNRRFGQMWGISDEILSARADTLLLDSVRQKLVNPDQFMEQVRQLYDRRDVESHDEVALIDGRTFDRYSAPMRDADGRYYGRVWYFRDVTEAKQAEAALRQERDRAQRYLDTADVILLALNADGLVTLINRKGCDLLGWSEAELIGQNWVDRCLPARIRPALTQKLKDLLGGDLSVIENPILTRDGRELLIEWRSRVLRDDTGRVTGTFSSGTDITEQHAAVEALRVAEERMRFALQSADVGIWDMDYATGVLQWSETLEAQYGLKPGTFGGTFDAFMAFVHPNDRHSLLETLGTAMKAGSDFSLQNRAVWPDGTVRWLSGAGRILLGEDGKPVRGVGISLDITSRHLLENQYHQAQKMEAMGRLAGGVAHDFNNLLTVILGYCELLLADRDPDAAARADIMQIQKAGGHAASLTRQLLAFSRKQLIEPTLLDLSTVVGDMRAMLVRLIGEDVKVTVNTPEAVALVKADRGQVEQVVMNLAVNARDAMPHGGTLTIGTANVTLDDQYAATHLDVKPGPYVALTVTDTGTGMTPEVQARLFEPFFTTKGPGKGTGLGLATVHGIVAQSGGSVGIDTQTGRGTSFTVYFPSADPRDVVPAARQLPRPRGGSETVLVVEDADGLRELTQRLLQRQGYTVLTAANADEALRLSEQHPSIDLILTDVVMPGASGPALIKQITGRRPGLKVIYMSGYTEDSITHHGVLKPGIAFLHKPFTSQTLGDKIREVLDR